MLTCRSYFTTIDKEGGNHTHLSTMTGPDMTEFAHWPTAAYHSATYPFIDPKRPRLSTSGRTAIVTGAGRGGIGHSIALSFAKSGITALGLIGRTESTLLQTKTAIERLSPRTKVFLYVADLVDDVATTSALDSFVKSTGSKIDILAANAGYMPYLTSIVDADAQDWWRTFEINIKGNFNLLRAYVPHAAQNGVVVHISTSAIHIPWYVQGSFHSGCSSSEL